jgi:hypothetical protein
MKANFSFSQMFLFYFCATFIEEYNNFVENKHDSMSLLYHTVTVCIFILREHDLKYSCTHLQQDTPFIQL